MAKERKMSMPLSTAGLIRYFDEYRERFQIKPEYVIYVGFAIAALEIIVRIM